MQYGLCFLIYQSVFSPQNVKNYLKLQEATSSNVSFLNLKPKENSVQNHEKQTKTVYRCI